MKKIFIGIMAMIATLTAFIACEDEIDEVAQWNKLADYSVRIAKLENACEILNSNVVSLNILAEAQKDNIGITDVKEVAEGCVIFFSDGRYVVLRNGADGKDGVDGKDGQDGLNGTNGVDGKDGKDGYVPAIAIKKDVDGIYYWTCDGVFMLDETGSKVPAQGKDGVNGTNGANGLVAQFMVSEDGELQYRYNDTDAWTSLGNVKGADGANGADGINGTNGTNGTNGVDGKSPTFKIVEGNLLVSYDGENWSDLGTVKGADGANGVDGANGTNGADGINGTNGTNGKDGITPEFKIDGGLWYVSYDNKTTWIELGQATGDKGEKGDTGAKGDKGDAGVNGTNGTNGTDGINGTNGTDGTNGKDGITPKLKIVDGYWYISYDGGATWESDPIGQATGDKGDKGDKGDAGVDGKTPTFKVEGGVLFVSYDATTWTSLGKISGENGTDGKTPTMKIEGGDWYVSYDEGETWTNLGQATGDKGDKGDNGITPTFKVESGNLYVSYNEGTSWTNLGNVKGADGTNGTAGVTPKLKITDGYWYISYDNEKTWTKLDKATGANGVDGKTPSFKVEGGVLFVSYDATTWTSLGKISGENGNNGVTPKFKITSGDWYVSYDEGETWTKLGQATGDKGDNGDNGITPTFKVESGNLYVSYNEGLSWSFVGMVKGTAGKDGVSPKFKITDGYWYVSYDNEKTWTKLDKATGADGKDGVSPELSINSEGHLISTVNGVATDLGNVTGATPVIKVEDGKWKVSTDGGTNWTEIEGSSTVGGSEYGYNRTVVITNGALPGEFSVSATKKVKFSMGNLQYQASTDTWRFAANQFDYVGTPNTKIAANYTGWIDLFGWGTSGYDNTAKDSYAKNFYPYSSSTAAVNSSYNSYGYGPSTNQTDKNLTGTSANYDWGVYNAISNGGNQKGQWRVLSKDEWTYLYSGRANAASLRTRATVEGVAGYIFFPDNWEQPEGISVGLDAGAFTTNSYSALRWNVLEAQGAVFLPAAGYRYGTTVGNVGSYGYYWSSTYSSYDYACRFGFNSSSVSTSNNYRYIGHGVRLVQD